MENVQIFAKRRVEREKRNTRERVLNLLSGLSSVQNNWIKTKENGCFKSYHYREGERGEGMTKRGWEGEREREVKHQILR